MRVRLALTCAGLVAAPEAPAVRPDAEPDLLAMMQGTWQSTEDLLNVFTISGDQMSSVYGDEDLGAETITVVADCETMAADTSGMAFTLTGQDEGPRCFVILDAGADRLDYSYHARGNTLSHRRVTP